MHMWFTLPPAITYISQSQRCLQHPSSALFSAVMIQDDQRHLDSEAIAWPQSTDDDDDVAMDKHLSLDAFDSHSTVPTARGCHIDMKAISCCYRGGEWKDGCYRVSALLLNDSWKRVTLIST